ncbi:MAG TPA: HAMP domain-containing sensor histidine kinase [Candidatus Dormibacteraeota bacterium]
MRPPGWQNPATKQLGPNSLGALARFGLLALVPVVALGFVIGREVNLDVQQRYLDSARQSGTLIAQVGIQPLLSAQMLKSGLSEPEIAEVDRRLQGAAVSQEVRRLKIWSRQGTVLYSDNHALIGRTFEIEEDLAEALEGHSEAGISDGHAPENQGDNLEGPLVEVYVPLVFEGDSEPSGAFELYLPYAPVQSAINGELQQLYIVLAIGLTLFYASMFPVVVIADRWRRRLIREAENTALANLAILERLNKLKSEFLTRISHQFRTALVGIEGFSELIRDSEDLDIDKVKAFASDIYSDAERLDQAFADMLELDRMEAGKSVLKLAQVDVNEVIQSTVENVRKDNPQHPVAVDLDPSVRSAPADRDKLSQLLTILLGNAMKYSPAGTEIMVKSSLDSNHVTVTVKDQGPGMPADFDSGMFVGMNGGTGLGLPIARQIVEMHGGRIWFESNRADGTEFHFSLPLKQMPLREVRELVRT